MIPIEVDGDFKTDANGDGTDTRRIQGGHWSAVYASCQCAGSGKWVAGKLGKAQFFHQGANVLLGPIILKPGEQAQVRVVGATASVQGSIVYWGWQGEATDGSDLASVVPSIESAGSLTGSVPISLTGPIAVSDGGLAGSLVASGSQMHLVKQQALTTNATTHIQVGANFAIPYPAGAASWQLVIAGLAGTGFGCRLFVQCYDNANNMLCARQRDSHQNSYDMIVASGLLDTEAVDFQITLPSGAPNNCFARLYMTAMPLQDNWYDNGIYSSRVANSQGYGTIGFDGLLLAVSGFTIPASQSTTFRLPTYRGPAQLGIQMGGAGHGAFAEADYLGTLLNGVNNFPVSTSGLQQQTLIVFLPGLSNSMTLYNDTASGNTVYLEMRAIKDLMT